MPVRKNVDRQSANCRQQKSFSFVLKNRQNRIIITSQNTNQIKDLECFGEHCFMPPRHAAPCVHDIITSRNTNQIKDLECFGEHCFMPPRHAAPCVHDIITSQNTNQIKDLECFVRTLFHAATARCALRT